MKLTDFEIQILFEKGHGKIFSNPKILGGTPCIAGTRIPVYVILEHAAAGYSYRRIQKSYPDLKLSDIKAAFEFAAALMEIFRL